MNALDLIALLFIPIMIVFAAAGIVFLGSLPGKIARGRNHPWPDAVNAASWIGLATGVLWPFAFVWAFLPLPGKSDGAGAVSGENADLQAKIDSLESELAQLKNSTTGGAKPSTEGAS